MKQDIKMPVSSSPPNEESEKLDEEPDHTHVDPLGRKPFLVRDR